MKLTTSLVVVLGLAVSGCGKKKEEGTQKKTDPTAPKVTEPAKPEAPAPLTGTALADKYKACVGMVNAGKWDEFRKDCIDDSYTHHAVAGMPEVKGGDALIGMFKERQTAFPDWKLEPQVIMVSGRNILAVLHATGTQSGPMKSPMGEVPATNKKVGFLMFHRLKIDDANKATEEWAYIDVPSMMGQLGLGPKGMPAPPVVEKGIEGAPIVVVTADDAKEKGNMDVAKKSNDAFTANKPADVIATMTDDAVQTDMGVDTKGAKAIEKGMTAFRNAFSDVKLSNTEMWAAGDYVVQTFTFEGKHDKAFGPIKKTGKQVAVDVAELMHFRDGKIDHTWRFMNGAQLMEQLGMTPPAAPGEKTGAAPKAGETPKAGEAPKGEAAQEPAKP